MELQTTTSADASLRNEAAREARIEGPTDVNGLVGEKIRVQARDDSSSNATDADVERNAESKPQPVQADVQNLRPDLVEFDGPNDPDNPKNWPKSKKWAITVSMGMMTFVVTFASSIFSVAIAPVAEEYDVTPVVATLGVTLFLFVSLKNTSSIPY